MQKTDKSRSMECKDAIGLIDNDTSRRYFHKILYKIEVMGISEVRWMDSGEHKYNGWRDFFFVFLWFREERTRRRTGHNEIRQEGPHRMVPCLWQADQCPIPHKNTQRERNPMLCPQRNQRCRNKGCLLCNFLHRRSEKSTRAKSPFWWLA